MRRLTNFKSTLLLSLSVMFPMHNTLVYVQQNRHHHNTMTLGFQQLQPTTVVTTVVHTNSSHGSYALTLHESTHNCELPDKISCTIATQSRVPCRTMISYDNDILQLSRTRMLIIRQTRNHNEARYSARRS